MESFLLENEQLRLTVAKRGASLLSIFDKTSGQELLWQGDEKTWKYQDVLIFPYMGKPDPHYLVDGKPYRFDAVHGVARNSTFSLLSRTPGQVQLELTADADTLRQYPFHFRLVVTFTLVGRGYTAAYAVSNTAGEDMPFYIGVHPGFNLVGGDTIVFEREEELFHFPKEGAGWSDKKERFGKLRQFAPTNEVYETYRSLVFDHVQSKTCALQRGDGIRLTIGLGDAPILTIWGRQNGGAYVCIEPWWGFLEPVRREEEFRSRWLINTVRGQEAAQFQYACTITSNP